MVWQSGPGWTVAGLIIRFTQGLLPLLTLYLTKLLVDAVAAGITSADKADAFRHVVLLIALIGGAALLNAGISSLAELVRENQSQRLLDHVKSLIHQKSIALDLSFYEDSGFYDTLHRAQQEGSYRPQNIVNGLTEIVRSSVSLLAIIGLLISFHGAVAAILFIAAVPGVLIRLRHSGRLYRWQRERTEKQRWANYFDWIITDLTFAKEIRLFLLGKLFRRRYGDIRKELRQERLRIATSRVLGELITQVGAVVAVIAGVVFITYRTVHGVITLGDMVMYYQAFQRGLAYMRGLTGALSSLHEDNLFLTNLDDFFNLRPAIADPVHPVAVPRPLMSGITFDAVTFSYPGGERNALEEVSLHIEPGEIVALVGDNGSGKSTLVKLLCRFYDPDEGRILIDKLDLREFESDRWRHEISVIFQDYARYFLTARENIWLGNIELPPDDERIDRAAVMTGAEKVIAGLPSGYDTRLGKWFHDGAELSVGEWQKLVLARSFLRESQVLVLDEPTSALDAETEGEMFAGFHEMMADRIAIIISHRFSTVRLADRIFVLERGRLVEEGSHDDLVKRGGKYTRMYEAQARKYR